MKKTVSRENLTALILSAILVVIVILSFVLIFREKNDDGRVVVVISCGKTVGEYSLDDIKEEKVIKVSSGESGHYNIIRITGDGVCVSESDCKGHDCVRMGTISHSGETIVCLPNRLIVTITSDRGSNEFDAVTY